MYRYRYRDQEQPNGSKLHSYSVSYLCAYHCNSLQCKTFDISLSFFPTSLFFHVFVKCVIVVKCYNWLEYLFFGLKNYFSNLKNVSSDIFYLENETVQIYFWTQKFFKLSDFSSWTGTNAKYKSVEGTAKHKRKLQKLKRSRLL